MFVPVVDKNNKPLMPTIPSRARKWIKSKKATPFWKQGIFCVRLNENPSNNQYQEIAIGIDPGSKKEGFTIKSEAHTFLNIQTDAVGWVKDALESRKNARKNRRGRKTPCRQPRFNRNRNKSFLAPSTKARWQWKLRICNWLLKVLPIKTFVIEDIKASTKEGQKKWNKSFSPLEVGKNWFYKEIRKLGNLQLKEGFETKQLRDFFGLKKTKNKLSEGFDAHCVDSWVLANDWIGGHSKPDNTKILFVIPLRFHRRQLHVFVPIRGNVRKTYGGTRSLRFKRGSLIKHKKYGVVYVGGTMKDRITVHNLKTGDRISRAIKSQDCKFLCYNSWRSRH